MTAQPFTLRDLPHLDALMKEGEEDGTHITVSYRNGLWTAEMRSKHAAGDTFPMFDPIRGEDALVGKGSTQNEALADLDAICGGDRSGYAAIRARGPFTLGDPNASAPGGYRPAYVRDAAGGELFCVSRKGEPTLARYVVDAMNAARGA